MSNRAVASAEALPEPTSALDGLAEQFREALGGPSPIERLPAIRQTISDLHAEAVRSGRDAHSRALARIGLLTEVWECLVSDSSSSADEVGFFCVKAVSQLARGNGGDDEGVVAWILDDSASNWGEYLALLEGQELGDAADLGPIADAEPQSDDLPGFDAQALLRLFTGALGGIASPEATPEGPKVSPAEKSAPPKPESAATPPKQQPPLCQPASAPISSPPEAPSRQPANAATPAPPQPPPRQAANTAAAAPPEAPGRQPASAAHQSIPIPELPRRIDLDDEIRDAFLADTTDLFERIEPLVLGLSRAADPRDSLRELGRCFHTLKGAAGSVGFPELATLVHTLEESLTEAPLPVSDTLIDDLHRTLGYLDGLLGLLRGTGVSAGANDRALPEPSHGEPAHQDAPQPSRHQALPEPSHGEPAHQDAPQPSRHQTHAVAPAPASAPMSEPASRPQETAASEQVSSTPPAAGSATPADGPIRVPASRFDELMDMVSELIARRRLWSAQAGSMKLITEMVRTSRARMLSCLDKLHEAGLGRTDRLPASGPASDIPRELRRMSELADDLAVMAETAQAAAEPLADHGDAMGRLTLQLWDELQAIRIVSIRGLFQRLTRVAYDAARVEGRQVEVVMAGEETGLDRAVQDKAFEPLLHVVRNSVGHGIETPAERTAAGKPATGKILLEARREGNTLVISVQDDGRGLNHEAIAAKARKLGLIGPDEHPGPERLNNLIFHSGFSTRSEANAISGRGVGMDVVAREVGMLKGTIELRTERGRGTRLTVRLPARLALETAMIVRVDGQAFALPVAQIESAQQLDAEAMCPSPAGKSNHQTGTVVTFRDRRLPVISAREMLGIARTPAPAWPKLLVVRCASGLIGLAVDAIEGTEELVIKSLGSLLAGHPVISGTSLSMSGEVISILNPSGLGRWVGDGLSLAPLVTTPGTETGSRSGPAVLVVDDSISVRRVVARHLRTMGLDVDEVSDGLEALGRLRARPYGLVVTDLEMPRLDGFELVAEMQRIAPLASIPVIVASTKVDEETRRRVLALGARAFLAKPVDPSALASVASPLLELAG